MERRDWGEGAIGWGHSENVEVDGKGRGVGKLG